MYSAGQIARAAAPVKTRMAMPAHLEAMITLPRPRPTFAPVPPVVDMAAIDAGRRAKEIAADADIANLAPVRLYNRPASRQFRRFDKKFHC